jgi:acetyl esterase/lipase
MSDAKEMRWRAMRWGAVLVLAGLLAAACGSDDAAGEDGAASEETTAVEETIEAGEDCRAGLTGEPLQLASDIPESDGVEVTCDLTYKAAPSGADQNLDVYKPAGTAAGAALPTVIFFYINGDPDAFFWPASREEWMTLDFKTGLDTHARVVASLGMVGITFDYSSYPMRSDYGEVSEENMGHAVQDAADLLAYVTANATDLNVDPSNICVWTEGTGSLVGAYTALAGDPRPKCAVIFTGTLNERYAGQYNPADLVTADMTPFFIARANADVYNNDGIDRFSFLAREAGADQVVVERVQASHGFNVKQPELPATQETIGKALDFIMEHLGVSGP